MNGIVVLGGFVKAQDMIVKSVIAQLSDYIDDFKVIDMYKGNKLTSLCNDVNVDFVKFDPPKKDETLLEYEKRAEKFFEENTFDTLFVLRIPIISSIKNGKSDYLNRMISNVLKDELKYINFASTDNMAKKFLFAYAASRKCKRMVQLVFDPQEIRLNEFIDENETDCKLVMTYYLKRKGCKFVPLYEKKLFDEIINHDNDVKDKQFCFYCTATSADRKFIAEKKNELESCSEDWDVLIVSRSNYSISQNTYYEKLSRSKYTLVIKSYDASTFSIIRFFESLFSKCLPLIVSDVCLEELKNTFPQVYKVVIDRDLIVELNADSIKRKCVKLEKDRETIINELLEAVNQSGILDDSKIKRFYERFMKNV